MNILIVYVRDIIKPNRDNQFKLHAQQKLLNNKPIKTKL